MRCHVCQDVGEDIRLLPRPLVTKVGPRWRSPPRFVASPLRDHPQPPTHPTSTSRSFLDLFPFLSPLPSPFRISSSSRSLPFGTSNLKVPSSSPLARCSSSSPSQTVRWTTSRPPGAARAMSPPRTCTTRPRFTEARTGAPRRSAARPTMRLRARTSTRSKSSEFLYSSERLRGSLDMTRSLRARFRFWHATNDMYTSGPCASSSVGAGASATKRVTGTMRRQPRRGGAILLLLACFIAPSTRIVAEVRSV